MKYKSSHLAPVVLSFLALFVVICPSAQATYIATLDQVGADVVGTGSGSLDFTALVPQGSNNFSPQIRASNGVLLLGQPTFEAWYQSVSGPSSFGSGGLFFANSAITGNQVGVVGAVQQLYVPANYISGTPLGISTSTWDNQTFVSLGVTPGTYVWTWGSGIHADSFTLQIGNGVPDSGSTMLLMLGAVGVLVAFRQKPEVSS